VFLPAAASANDWPTPRAARAPDACGPPARGRLRLLPDVLRALARVAGSRGGRSGSTEERGSRWTILARLEFQAPDGPRRVRAGRRLPGRQPCGSRRRAGGQRLRARATLDSAARRSAAPVARGAGQRRAPITRCSRCPRPRSRRCCPATGCRRSRGYCPAGRPGSAAPGCARSCCPRCRRRCPDRCCCRSCSG